MIYSTDDEATTKARQHLKQLRLAQPGSRYVEDPHHQYICPQANPPEEAQETLEVSPGEDFTHTDTVYKFTLKLKSLKIKVNAKFYPTSGSGAIVDSPEDIFIVLQKLFEQLDDGQTHLVMLAFDDVSGLLGYKVIGSGGQSDGVMDAKILFRSALMLGAGSIVMAHNRPGGSVKPSPKDIADTETIAKAGDIIDIELIDHIILTSHRYFSMKIHMRELFRVDPSTQNIVRGGGMA
jgi:DNA repair protein RadC